MYYVCLKCRCTIIFYPKEQKEQKEQKSKKKKQSNFLFAEKVETLHKKRTRTKKFHQTLLLVFYSTKNKDDVLERLREIQRENEEREEDATTATGTLSTTRWWGGRRE